ncbi:MAG TPA: penicillin-binding protein activator LpoB [Paraburkholderia sp.]|nr:penicillin-binding protein activator LpoB [Paraburkholderia sp.]
MSTFQRFARLASWGIAAVASSWLIAGCGTLKETAAPTLGAGDPVAVASIANYTETPSAGRSAESIAASVLRANGLKDVRFAPADAGSSALFDTAQRESAQQKLEWAQSQQVKYILTGAVEEWRYKVGVDGEPVVGITLELIDVQSGNVVWSATGARSGWSRSSLSSVATSLIGSVLSPLAAHR